MRFENLDPAHRLRSSGDVWRWAVRDRLLGRRRLDPPGPPAPRIEPDLERIRTSGGPDRLTWIGHASFLATLDGRHVLVDPVFSNRLAGVYRRHTLPAFAASDLPAIDLLLVTHSHYDHLDEPSVKALPRSTPVVVPLGLGRWFRRRGFERVVELDRWQDAEIAGLRITLTPARHWSRRGIFDINRTLWGGFVVGGRDITVYFAGDTGYFAGFAEIGRRFLGLAAAVLPIGAYRPAWFMEPMHLNPEQAGQAFVDTGADVLVPMHWGSFQLTDESLCEPAERLRAWWKDSGPGDGRRLELPGIGETVTLGPVR